MNKNPLLSRAFGNGGLPLPLRVLLLCSLPCSIVWGGPARYQDIDLGGTCPTLTVANIATLDAKLGTPANMLACPGPGGGGCDIAAVNNPQASVTWLLENDAADGGCEATSPFVCAGMSVTPPPDGSNGPVLIKNTNPLTAATSAYFFLTATASPAGSPQCKRWYHLEVTSDGGGWGDPHLTTVDGVQYDFQGAGEFATLRGKGMEIQTRQTPVATTFLPGASAYSGLPTCVSIYSAVAARVGTHRISYQPNISGVPDPTGLQLRVDGVLTPLGPEGIDLGSAKANPPGGRIVQSSIGGGMEIHYSDGTQLVVVPAYWPDQQKWYLNVNVYGTTASEGILGKLAKDSWLPALPDGTSLGPKPDSLHQRYVDLYQNFADAWRVTDATSLFDYAPGTSTATFSLAGWPRESPRSCAIPQQPSAQPVAVTVAETACAAITDSNMKADCVFDVSVTGYTGFAQTYLVTQQLKAAASAPAGWAGTSTAGGGTGQGHALHPPLWLILLLLIILILLAIWWIRRK
jgi:hypothetical protein